MAHQRSRQLTDLLLLAGFCAFLFFYGIGYFGLVGADEPRYAQVAREMLERHDWITPTLGQKPWLEKPALFYWQAMIAFKVFGVSDWAARLPSAFDATLTVAAIYAFLRKFRPGSELDGALMTASAAGIITFARAASTDMPLAAMFTLAMLSWYAWHETDEKWFLGMFYAFSGLGTLAKGPVAVLLAVLIVVAFAWAKSDLRVITRTLWLTGILIFCAVTLPWYIAVQWKNPEFFRVFLLEHNLARFSSDLYHHREPFWYYAPIMLLASVPWTIFVLASGFEVCAAWWREKREMLRSQDAWNIFLIFWLIIPVLFFSISQSKLPGYILPAVPAGTLLLAEYVRRHEQEHERTPIALAILHSIVAMAPVVPAIMVSYILAQHKLPWFTGTKILFTLAAILAAGMAATLCSRIGLNALRFVTLVPVVLTVTALLRIGAPVVDSLYSARSLDHELSQLQSELPPVAVFQVRRETEYGLAFYRNQAIDRYERGEIPAEAHLVVAPHGLQQRVASKVPGRRLSYLGSFPPQNLDYFWVAMQGAGHQH